MEAVVALHLDTISSVFVAAAVVRWASAWLSESTNVACQYVEQLVEFYPRFELRDPIRAEFFELVDDKALHAL